MIQKLITTTTDPEKMDMLFDGIRELIWKLKDNLRIASAMELASVDETVRTAAAKAIGDAAILQHQIETKPGQNNSTTMKAGRYELSPGLPDTHKHTVTLNAEGSGTSSVTDEHSHKVVAMNVQLANDHTHTLLPLGSEEVTPMDEDKTKPEKKEDDEVDPPATVDTPPAGTPKEEPKTEAPEDEEATPPADAPPEKDEATLFVDELIRAEHTKLVDSIMDFGPPEEREHYEAKTLDELRELSELLKSQSTGDGLPAAAAKTATDGAKAIDDEYAKVEEKLRSRQ